MKTAINYWEKLRIPLKLCLSIFLLVSSLTTPVYAETDRKKQIEQFKKAQKCYAQAVANENWQQGLKCAEKSLITGHILFSVEHKNTAALTYNYALMLAKNKHSKKASDEFKKTLKLYKKLYGSNSDNVAWVLLDYADSQVGVDSNLASKNYVKALEILSKQDNFNPLDKAKISLEASVNLSSALLTNKSKITAIEFAQDAYQIYKRIYGESHQQTALTAFTLGKLRYLGKDYKKAIELMEQSLINEDVANYAHGFLVEIYSKNGRDDLAEKHLKALSLILPTQENRNYQPVYIESPKYPRKAQSKNIEGYAIIKLVVTNVGSVREPVLVKEHPESWGFGKAAMKVAKKLKYVPRVKGGKAVEVPDTYYKYIFKMYK